MDSTSIAPTRPGTSSKLAVVECEVVSAELWTWLQVMAERYQAQSGDRWPAGTALARLRAHELAGGKAMALWLLLDGALVRGYAVTELQVGPHGHEAFVAEAYVEPSCRRRGVLLSAMIVFERWARRHRCRALRFATRRSDAAYARILGRAGFARAEVTFTKPLGEPDGV